MRYAMWLAATLFTVAPSVPTWAQTADAKPDLARAQQIVNQVCAACHGSDGNSTAPANPNLAGQQAQYITVQLEHFKSGVRNNPVMSSMASPLTAEEMRALGVYFSQQKAKGSAAKDHEVVLAGQKVYRGGNAASGLPPCAACHTPTGVGIPARYPRLSGQYSDYTYAQLKAFKAGERGSDKEGKDINGKVMAQVASRMSDSEMQAVAQYAAGLH
ncbi:MAG: cytochrome c4 [Betaproteobacteria bacterium]|nr:MAG: cytochrome c4 [Betaproteobacteria bacterium]